MRTVPVTHNGRNASHIQGMRFRKPGMAAILYTDGAQPRSAAVKRIELTKRIISRDAFEAECAADRIRI